MYNWFNEKPKSSTIHTIGDLRLNPDVAVLLTMVSTRRKRSSAVDVATAKYAGAGDPIFSVRPGRHWPLLEEYSMLSAFEGISLLDS